MSIITPTILIAFEYQGYLTWRNWVNLTSLLCQCVEYGEQVPMHSTPIDGAIDLMLLCMR